MNMVDKEAYLKTVKAWVESEEGPEEFREILASCRKVTKELEKRRKVHWLDMLRPMTI